MENLVFLLTASLVLYQSSKKPRRMFIGDTNCSVVFSPEAEFDFTTSKDGDQMYFAEHTEKNIAYGVLCAQVNSPLPVEEAQAVMVSFLNRLQKPFNALYSTGVDLCQSWSLEKDQIKMVDYWQDEDGLDWKVKGYTDGRIIAVLYVKNINEISVEKQDKFLDSFCFSK
jgi:hypothetical protein